MGAFGLGVHESFEHQSERFWCHGSIKEDRYIVRTRAWQDPQDDAVYGAKIHRLLDGCLLHVCRHHPNIKAWRCRRCFLRWSGFPVLQGLKQVPCKWTCFSKAEQPRLLTRTPLHRATPLQDTKPAWVLWRRALDLGSCKGS